MIKWWKWVLMAIVLFLASTTKAIASKEDTPEELKKLYATAACLMDAESGRILFEKNGEKQLPMASTTKIMTCIVTLENADTSKLVTISKNAARQPDVQLNVNTGEEYILKDLLYSLMLESHNDAAVAIAESVGGSVEGFAALMNKKAKELSCNQTYFITPNGLDATNEVGTHATSATDLAKIMSYCIEKSPKATEFLEITGTQTYNFTNKVTKEGGTIVNGNRSFSCRNHNAFLTMMEGAISGKTGFTGNAGYCYVGALKQDGKTFVVSLLACGWPNNKSYKWSDTKKLMNYGIEHYEYQSFDRIAVDESKCKPIEVVNGQTDHIGETKMVDLSVIPDKENEINGLLLKKEEQIQIRYNIKKNLCAPVTVGEQVGSIQYLLNQKVWREDIVITKSSIDKINLFWCLEKVVGLFLI
ncbi:MAG: D-alanyl-D-alanine carboxypeptidase family protein [Velocimicrobium sp.]